MKDTDRPLTKTDKVVVGIIMIIIFTLMWVTGNAQFPADQYQICERRDVPVGYVSVTSDKLWIKLDYQLGEEYVVKHIERTPARIIFYVESGNTIGFIAVDNLKLEVYLLRDKRTEVRQHYYISERMLNLRRIKS